MKSKFEKIRPMDYIPLLDSAAREVIDSATIFGEFMRVQAQARQYSGGMYWKRKGAYEYLVKTLPDNRQQRVQAMLDEGLLPQAARH